MKKIAQFCALVVVCSGATGWSGPAAASPEADATAIAEYTMTDELFAVQMEGVAGLVADSIVGEFRRAGTSLSDESAQVLTAMFLPLLAAGMGTDMRAGSADALVQLASPEALAAYRAFLETPEGQEIAAIIPAYSRAQIVLGEQVGAGLGESTVQAAVAEMQADRFPIGTSPAVKAELKRVFEIE